MRDVSEWNVGKKLEGYGRGLFAGIVREDVEETHEKL